MLPTSTRVTLDVDTKLSKSTKAVVVFVTKDGKFSGDTSLVLGSTEFETAQRMVRLGIVRGKAREVDFDLLESPKGTVRRIYVAGLGPSEKLTAEVVRESVGAVLKTLRKHRVEQAAIVPPVIGHGRDATGAQVTAEALLLAAFQYREYLDPVAAKKKESKDDADEAPLSQRITILSSASAKKAITVAVDRGRLLADAQNFARTIAFRPGNEVNPPRLAEIAQQAAKETGLKLRVLDEKEMKRLGMGGILAVGSGSTTTPPRMIVLEHRGSGKKNQRPLLLVGKAITFDTGGISIKPAANMHKMVFDKCGAMAVLGAMVAIARRKLPNPVIGILSAAENHVSGTSYRPGDILRMYNGMTVEITNTDAEGRLVLADALSWGIETYKPSAVIDLATLTGAMVIALGHEHCGVMSNSDELIVELQAAADQAGEKIWRLPVTEGHREGMKSDVADLVNSGSRDASSLKAAAFIKCFIPKDDSVPWVHMDVAGVADTEKELPYYGKGATGWGVRTLVHLAEARAAR